MKKNTHKKDKKLHNFEEELHNSSDAELSWREAIDLSPEDEGESGSEIYYFTDGDGNSYSREFLAQELISDDHAAEDSLERKSSGELQKLKPGATDIVNLIQDAQDTPEQITLPAPKSGGRPLDVRISSEIAPDLFDKQESLQSSEVAAANKHVIIHLDEGESAVDNIQATPDDSTRAGEPLTLNFSQTELDEYVRYRSEGIAKKSKDWINRSSQAVWEMTEGEVSHNTMTRLRTFVLDRYTSADSHSKVLGFAVGFLRYLAQRHIDQRYLSFTLFLERPKSKKVKKALTERIITRKEISQHFNA